jgi:hypothetical protein
MNKLDKKTYKFIFGIILELICISILDYISIFDYGILKVIIVLLQIFAIIILLNGIKDVLYLLDIDDNNIILTMFVYAGVILLLLTIYFKVKII